MKTSKQDPTNKSVVFAFGSSVDCKVRIQRLFPFLIYVFAGVPLIRPYYNKHKPQMNISQ